MTSEKIKSTSKDELEWAVLPSDRISLVDAAVDVLDCIQGRYAVATLASVPQDVRLTDAETEAYNAALGFLAREFKKGACAAESHMTRSVTERSEEMQPGSALLAKLKLQVIGEIIDAMDREILATHEFFYDKKWAERRETSGRLLDPERTYLMAEEECPRYYAIRDDRIAADGWEVPERGYCPKCMADTELRDANHALIAEAAKFPSFQGVSVDALLCAGMKKYEEFIDLCIKLVVTAVEGCSTDASQQPK